jgi:hypothetical protein
MTPTQDSTQAGASPAHSWQAFVEEVMQHVRDAADSSYRAGLDHSSFDPSRNRDGDSHQADVTEAFARARSALTTHASQQAAVVAGLVGALEFFVKHPGVWQLCTSNSEAMNTALSAIAAASDHAMKEQP